MFQSYKRLLLCSGVSLSFGHGGNMSQRLKKNFELLKILKKAKPQQRKLLLKSAENSLILCLCECIDNVLRGNVKLSPAKKRQLSKYASILRKIVDRKTKVNRKRELLIQQGGFLPALLAPVIGIASGLIGELVGNLIK